MVKNALGRVSRLLRPCFGVFAGTQGKPINMLEVPNPMRQTQVTLGSKGAFKPPGTVPRVSGLRLTSKNKTLFDFDLPIVSLVVPILNTALPRLTVRFPVLTLVKPILF